MAVSTVRQGTVSSDIQALAAALLAKQREPITALQSRQTALSRRSSVLGSLKTRLLALRSELDGLASIGTLSPFATKSATSSETSVLGVTAAANAAVGTLSITIDQLARRATHASNRYSDAGTTLSGAGTGTFAFTITIGGTDYDASVTINGGDTDKTVLDNVAAAINTALGAKGSATRLAPTAGTSRLSVSSATSGTGGKLAFTDTDGLLARLGIVNGSPTAATDTTGGYLYEDLGDHELDAKLVVDGLTYYRESNTVSDLVTGVTFTLKATAATAVTAQIQPDADRAVQKVKDFIAKYNDVLDYLGQQTATDPKAGVRGALVGDPVFFQLGNQLRVKLAGRVASQASGAPDNLGAIGLATDSTGKLTVKNETTLRDAFVNDPAAFAALFNAEDGFATILRTFVDGFAKTTGTIAANQNQINVRINGLKTQIDRLNESLLRKQAALENQLARNQATLTRLAQQSQQISNILSVVG
jgi:flagellar hook-associated protein 2